MANQTVTTLVNFDDPSILGLMNGEDITINGGGVVVDSDVMFCQNSAVIGNVTISSTLGGLLHLDGTKVWEIPYDASTGNVPSLGALGTNTVTGGTSGATGELIGVFTGQSNNGGDPIPKYRRAPGQAMSTGQILKLRYKSGNFVDNETITLFNGATVVVNSLTGGRRSCIHVVGEYQGLITIPRLGELRATGDWYELGVTGGLNRFGIPTDYVDFIPAVWVETAPGSGVFEVWENAGNRLGNVNAAGATPVNIPTDDRGKYFAQCGALNCDTTNGSATISNVAGDIGNFNPELANSGSPVLISGGFANPDRLWVVDPNGGNLILSANSNLTGSGRTISLMSTGIRFGGFNSATGGRIPPSGCRVRIPNIFISVSESPFTGVTCRGTLADRWETLTTSAGVINIDKVSAPGLYINAASPYSVSIANSGLTAVLISNVASTCTIENCGFGIEWARELTPVSISACLTGVVLDTVSATRYAASGAGNNTVTLTDCANITIDDCRFSLFGSATLGTSTRNNADVRSLSLARCFDVDIARLTTIGGRVRLSQVSRCDILDTRYADLLTAATSTTNPLVGAFEVTDTSSSIFIDGFSNLGGIANVHPYTAILLISGSASGIEFRNLGTASAPYHMGSANACGNIVSASVCIDVRMRRLYADNVRSAALSLANTVQNVTCDNVWGDAGDSQSISALAITARGCRWTYSTTGQASVYGRHWEDAFISTTAGRIVIAANEALPSTASQVSTSFGSGAGFTSTGSVVMPNVSDSITWTMPYFALGITSLTNSAPVITGTNTANFSLEFQWDSGSGFNGTWLALTGANLNALGAINPATGVKLMVRATTTVANASNALTYIAVITTTDATSQRQQYPLPTTLNAAQVSGISTGSRIQVYNVTTATEIANEIISGTSWTLAYPEGNPFSNGDVIRIRLTKAGLLPLQLQTIASASGWTALASQASDTVYVTNGIDGSTVTEFTADYPTVHIDISDPDGVTTVQRMYAWMSVIETTADGIRNFFNSIVADDLVNYKVVTSLINLKLDNITASPVIIAGARLYRDDGSTVIAATSGSIQMDPDKVYAIETGTSGLTPTEAATLAKLNTLTEDVGGLRFTTKALEQAPAGGGGGSSDWTAGEKEQIRHRLGIDGAATAPTASPSLATPASVRTNLATELGRIDVAISTRNATAPDNAGIAAIKAKTDLLPADPASNAQVNTRLAAASYTAPPTAAQNASQVRTELTTELGRIDAAISTRATPAQVNAEADQAIIDAGITPTVMGRLDVAVSSRNATPPDNATIASIAAKTAALPPDPADASDVAALIGAISAQIAALPGAPSADVIADAILSRNLAGGSNGGRTVRDALRPSRNRVEITGSTIRVYAEDDTTVAWEAAISTEARDALKGIDPS